MSGRKRALLAVAALLGPMAWLGITSASASDRGAENRLDGWPTSASGVASGQDAQRLAAARAALPREGVTRVFIAKLVREAEVDVGEEGESAGDFFVFEEDLFETSGRPTGSDSVRCELRVQTFACEGTIWVKGKGKIEIGGALFTENDLTVPVTGGTGVYEGIGGTLRVLDLDGGDTALIFHLVR